MVFRPPALPYWPAYKSKGHGRPPAEPHAPAPPPNRVQYLGAKAQQVHGAAVAGELVGEPPIDGGVFVQVVRAVVAKLDGCRPEPAHARAPGHRSDAVRQPSLSLPLARVARMAL